MNRRPFLKQLGFLSTSAFLMQACALETVKESLGVRIEDLVEGEDIFSYILRKEGKFDLGLYKKIIGAANSFKEGDAIQGVAAADESSRGYARTLLSGTRIGELMKTPLFRDEQFDLIISTTQPNPELSGWTMGDLRDFLLNSSEEDIKLLMPSLTSDVIAMVVKLMSNEQLIQVGSKIFNPLPGSNIGSKGYLGARVQPNSPTDDPEDIVWQVFDAWCYGVGDVVLGTNPVSSDPSSVAQIEKTLFGVLKAFGLEGTMPNCVLAHIDVQAQAEAMSPGTTGIWFQSLAGTDKANQTFDVTIKKMVKHARGRKGKFGLYAETGQGADGTNGHGEGFDMVVHESRKYGFLRALKTNLPDPENTWVFVNDVAGFIGPEVFRTKEQLVRCCLEDIVMGKLHGHTLGLDICSTLHMDVSLDDLDWCIDQIMPANPSYLMALPTKNDPMLSYLTTSFHDHLRIRKKFGYKVSEKMLEFFTDLGVLNADGSPGEHFGDPVWVYYNHRRQLSDSRPKEVIYLEGHEAIARIRSRGVPVAEGYGKNFWEAPPQLEAEVRRLYADARKSIWTEMPESFAAGIAGGISLRTNSADRKDYIYHPESGETLSRNSEKTLKKIRANRATNPDVQIIVSDGLNAEALMDVGHLAPFLDALGSELGAIGMNVAKEIPVLNFGRVRAGYACGEILFGEAGTKKSRHGIIHIIGERPGSGHHSFSAYITFANASYWGVKGKADHDITRVVSGISDTSLLPVHAAKETALLCKAMMSGVSGQKGT